MIEAVTYETPNAFRQAVAMLARRRRTDITALTAQRCASLDAATRDEGEALRRAALAERRRMRGPNKLARRLRRKVELGRHGSF